MTETTLSEIVWHDKRGNPGENIYIIRDSTTVYYVGHSATGASTRVYEHWQGGMRAHGRLQEFLHAAYDDGYDFFVHLLSITDVQGQLPDADIQSLEDAEYALIRLYIPVFNTHGVSVAQAVIPATYKTYWSMQAASRKRRAAIVSKLLH